MAAALPPPPPFCPNIGMTVWTTGGSRATKGWLSRSSAVGRAVGSRCRQSRMNSAAWGDSVSGMVGSSAELAILKMACTCGKSAREAMGGGNRGKGVSDACGAVE